MAEKLMACPFCGGEASRDCGDVGHWTVCMNVHCGAIGPIEPFAEVADDAWNTRDPLRDEAMDAGMAWYRGHRSAQDGKDFRQRETRLYEALAALEQSEGT